MCVNYAEILRKSTPTISSTDPKAEPTILFTVGKVFLLTLLKASDPKNCPELRSAGDTIKD